MRLCAPCCFGIGHGLSADWLASGNQQVALGIGRRVCRQGEEAAACAIPELEAHLAAAGMLRQRMRACVKHTCTQPHRSTASSYRHSKRRDLCCFARCMLAARPVRWSMLRSPASVHCHRRRGRLSLRSCCAPAPPGCAPNMLATAVNCSVTALPAMHCSRASLRTERRS